MRKPTREDARNLAARLGAYGENGTPVSTQQTQQANSTNASRARNTGNGEGYQVRETGYQATLRRANGRHVVPPTGRY